MLGKLAQLQFEKLVEITFSPDPLANGWWDHFLFIPTKVRAADGNLECFEAVLNINSFILAHGPNGAMAARQLITSWSMVMFRTISKGLGYH
ncbi:hypothetical protein C7271_26605 [filamentous cyanobacterium CCP5]|nr:hypothetical protein C7271_26605 [filamentous cyanobacterium CCP5]